MGVRTFTSPFDVGITLPGEVPVFGGTRIDITGIGGGAQGPSGSPVVPSDQIVAGSGCFPGFCPNLSGRCVPCLGERVGPDVMPATGNGAAGPLHAGDHMPFQVSRTVRQCLPGHVLGKDEVCHAKRDIRNAQRLYPKERRPLGTSGDLNAVTKASAFGRRLVANKKKLKKLQQNLARASG